MLPSHGRCHAVFLLAHCARLSKFYSEDEWIRATRDRLTLMASAYDLEGAVQFMKVLGLAVTEPAVKLDPALVKLSFEANRSNLLAIACMLLKLNPPGWLKASIVGQGFQPDLVPTKDLAQLKWMGEDLSDILVGVFNQIQGAKSDFLKKQLGDAGEYAVVSALKKKGKKVEHVALVSDSYGFDIRYQDTAATQKVEVKSCVEATKDRFFISRNEYDTACVHISTWKVVQVTFSSSVLVSGRATASEILLIRELDAPTLTGLAPKHTQEFHWTESAILKPPAHHWKASDLKVAADFDFKFTA